MFEIPPMGHAATSSNPVLQIGRRTKERNQDERQRREYQQRAEQADGQHARAAAGSGRSQTAAEVQTDGEQQEES